MKRYQYGGLPIAYCLLPIPEPNDLRSNKYETVSIWWAAYC